MEKSTLTGMGLSIPTPVLLTEGQTMGQEPLPVHYELIGPDGTGVITKGTFLSLVGGSISLR